MRGIRRALKNNKLLFIILAVALLVRFIGLVPNIAHTDEAYIIKHAKALFYNIITNGDFEPHAYKYGSWIFYLQSLVYIPFWIIGIILTNLKISQPPPTSFNNKAIDFIEYVTSDINSLSFLEGRALTAIIGTISVLIVYLIAKKLFNPKIGFLSALIFALNPLHVRDSHYITTDVSFIFLILLSLLFMVKAVTTSRLKWYLASGFLIGLSSTIKYFPLAFLAYPFVIFLDKDKLSKRLSKFSLGLLAIPVGIFIGVPYLFFSADSRHILQEEAGAQFLWYGTSITAFMTSILSYISSGGKSSIPSLSTLIPTGFKEFHSSFLIFRVLGPGLALVSIGGIFLSLFRHLKKTLFLLIIPLFTFIYNSFYIPAVYERLNLPLVPFLSIFAAIFLLNLKDNLGKIIKKRVNVMMIFFVISGLVLYHPITTSVVSSWSCGGVSPDEFSVKWINENISADKKIAQVSPIALPKKSYQVTEVRPDTDFFLTELQERKFDYFFINTGILSRFTYMFENNFFIIPQPLYQNYYVTLAMREYFSRANLLKSFTRDSMCDMSGLYFSALPTSLPTANNLIKRFSFDKEQEKDFWRLEELGNKSKINISFSLKEGHSGKGSLEYDLENIYYRGPRLMSPKISVTPSEVYTLTGWLKPVGFLNEVERDGFLRIDFFNKEDANINLPGEVIALSPRVFGQSKWYKISVTAKAPPDARFAILSFNMIGTKNSGTFYLDDIEFLGP
ncbi:glycosyltransferase family 39 protein [Candidatus Microgenomates bacterium]|nr:glycosyltransferase family 39 protein [Candidatus Microgenomates bacterium]